MPYPKKSPEARTIAFERSRAAKWSRVRFRDNRVEETKGTDHGAIDECWCGEKLGHQWPGRDEGKPHPLNRPPSRAGKALEDDPRIALQNAGVCPKCRGYPTEMTGPVKAGKRKGEQYPWCKLCGGTGQFPPPSAAAVGRWQASYYQDSEEEP